MNWSWFDGVSGCKYAQIYHCSLLTIETAWFQELFQLGALIFIKLGTGGAYTVDVVLDFYFLQKVVT